MLKGLLYIFVSLFAFAGYSQTQGVPEWSGPAESVMEDPNKIVSDLSATLTEGSKILLSWKVNGDLPDFFAIERSENGKIYEVVTVLNKLSPGGAVVDRRRA